MLAGELDEFGMPRAFVSIQPSIDDNDLWSAMDTASDDAAMVFANNQAYEVLVGNSFVPVAAGRHVAPKALLAVPNARIPLEPVVAAVKLVP